MPILKLHLENVGPFDALELDFTKPDGSAHLGPHILTGVNGSGKTTVLRAIVWCLATGNSGFGRDGWHEFLEGREGPKALLITDGELSADRYHFRALVKQDDRQPPSVLRWLSDRTGREVRGVGGMGASVPGIWELNRGEPETVARIGCIAAYAPSPGLRRLAGAPDRTKFANRGHSLSFDGTVSNEAVQAFLVDSLSKESFGKPELARRLRAAIALIIGDDAQPTVNLERPFLEAVLRHRGALLNFSQLPAGFSATLGWVVDYLLRQEEFLWPESMKESRPGLLLIDEIDVHLHPQWQRCILNGIRAAFPNAQIIVTTHSPFVVTSSEEARVHVLQVGEHGRAFLAETIDRPDSASIDATIHGVFGIKGRFGPEVEELLKEWNDLKKRDHFGKLNAKEKTKLRVLAKKIASRGEELASLVHDPDFSSEAVEELLALAGPAPKRR